MSFHELGHDLIFAGELGLEGFDLLILGIFAGLGLPAVVESEVGVLEELALPLIEDGGVEPELIAQVGNGSAFKKMALDDSGLLLRCEMAANLFVGHWRTSVQAMLTRTERFSRFD